MLIFSVTHLLSYLSTLVCASKMSETKLAQVILFDGTNYASWRPRMILKFIVKDLMDAVMMEDYKDLTKDAEARILILEHIQMSHDHLVYDKLSAYDMWIKLDAQFNKVSMSSVVPTI